MTDFYLTDKQFQLLSTVAKKNKDESLLDLDQVLEKLPYSTTKQSLQFSIRGLIDHGLLLRAGAETRRGRKRRLLKVTESGERMTRSIEPNPEESAAARALRREAEIEMEDLDPQLDVEIEDNDLVMADDFDLDEALTGLN